MVDCYAGETDQSSDKAGRNSEVENRYAALGDRLGETCVDTVAENFESVDEDAGVVGADTELHFENLSKS